MMNTASRHGARPLFTICIPAYEDADALERAIKSVKSQSVAAWECIIGDDSESYVIERMLTENVDKRIQYFHNRPAKGVPANWNLLISKARGQYITLLHQDDFYVNDDVLKNVLACLQKCRANLAVCAYSLWINRKRIALYNKKHRDIQRFSIDFPHRSLVINKIGHPSVIFLKNDLKGVLFDNSLCYFVDTDWYARLWKLAGEPVYIANAEIGIEKGRAFQLSQKCMRNFELLDAELERSLRKWNASAMEAAAGFARFYASHLRQISVAWPALKRRMSLLSYKQKCIFLIMLSVLFWHMAYRAIRKSLGLTHWA